YFLSASTSPPWTYTLSLHDALPIFAAQDAQVIPSTNNTVFSRGTLYPVSSITLTRSSGLVLLSSNSTVAFSPSKLTATSITPSVLLRALSTLLAQDEQVIPETAILTFLVVILSSPLST